MEVATEKRLSRRYSAQPAGSTNEHDINTPQFYPKETHRHLHNGASYHPYDTHDCRDMPYPSRVLTADIAYYGFTLTFDTTGELHVGRFLSNRL